MVVPTMKLSSTNLQMLVLAFNALMGVSLVIVKRWLIGIQGYNYSGFTTTLAAIHYLCFATAIQVHQRIKGNLQTLKLAYPQEFMLVVLVCASQILQNLSLMMNPMGLYAVMQSITIPVGLLVITQQQRLSAVFKDMVLLAGLTMSIGALIFMVNCGGVSNSGFVVAVGSMLFTSLQCLVQGRLAGQLGLHSLNLDAEIACPACLLMLLAGPQIDFAIHGQEMLEYTFPHTATLLIITSCTIATLWGISCYPSENVVVSLEGVVKINRQLIIGQQVLKIIVIAVAANIMFFEDFPLRKIVGLVLYMAGFFWFGFIVLRDMQNMVGSQIPSEAEDFYLGNKLNKIRDLYDEEERGVGSSLLANFRGLMRVKYLFSRV